MVLIVAFFVPTVLFLIYGLPVVRKEGFSAFFGPLFPKVYLPPKGPAEAFLQANFPYYRALSPKAKKKFFRRLGILLHNKEFTGANGFVVTDEMRYYVLACWVQITFGLQRYKMPGFEKIVIYETSFYSTRLDKEVKGIASPAGIIYLSWADFLEGYANTTDNYNLGIHELSHAFLISTFKNGDFDIEFSSYIDQWFEATKVEFENLTEGLPSYLRDYAGANSYEFFSVCMETFFESPQELKDKLPDVFYHLCYLLNQNPLNTTADYSFTVTPNIGANSKVALPDKQVRSLKYTGFHWLYLLPVAATLGFIFAFRCYLDTMITFPEFFLIFITGVSIGAIKGLRKKIVGFFGARMAIMFSVTVLGFGLLNIICIGNFYIPVSKSYTEDYVIVAYRYGARYANNMGKKSTPVARVWVRRGTRRVPQTTYMLENDALGNFPELRTRDGHGVLEPNGRYLFELKYHYGIFGLKVVESTNIIKVE